MNREHIYQYSANIAAWKAEDKRFDSLQKWAVHLFRSVVTISYCYTSTILKKKRQEKKYGALGRRISISD